MVQRCLPRDRIRKICPRRGSISADSAQSGIAATVAYVMYQKYINSMPLYRQEKEWKQMGVSIQRATLANWCIYCGKNYMKPLYDALAKHLLEREVTCADETPCQVLKEDGRKAQQKSYMWIHYERISMGCHESFSMNTILHGQERYRRTSTSRSAASTSWQMGIRDTIICRRASSDVAAWHISGVSSMTQYRQRTARVVSPSHLQEDLNLCSKLFEIERGFIDGAEERKIKREASKEHEIWNQIWESLDQISASKTSLLGKAVTYAQNQKPYMENYFLDGSIPISNNFTESCGARPYAVGRKNFYFHDTPAGAEASAIIYSLALTAKLNNLSVFKYLQAVLLYMPDYVHEPEGMEELMPWSDR